MKRSIARSDPDLREECRNLAGKCREAFGEAFDKSRPKAVRDNARRYAKNLEENLLDGITRQEIEQEFQAGAGKELESKMLAPWSSSALVVNSFAPWRRSPATLRLAGLKGFTKPFEFEAQCPNRVSRIPPHLDLLLGRGEEIVGVESKCIEFLTPKLQAVSPKYKAIEDARATSRWFAALDSVPEFLLLDAYQLIKHVLGLTHTYSERSLTLVYIYWEPDNAGEYSVFKKHREEVQNFSGLVEGDTMCSFRQITYPKHWTEQESATDQPAWIAQHIARLRQRYAINV